MKNRKTPEMILKSNIVLAMLLFAFNAFAVSAECDTLILDGEIIELQRRDKVINVDSLQKEMKEDVRAPKEPVYVSASLFPLGLEISRCRWNSDFDSLSVLNKYLGEKQYWRATYRAGVGGAVMVTNQLGIHLGIGFSTLKFGYHTVDPSQLAPDANRFRFENRDGQLYQYFTYPVGVGFETDTTLVPTRDVDIQFSVLDLPFGIRIYPTSFNQKIAPYIDLGAIMRFRMNDVKLQDAVLVADNGAARFVQLQPSLFQKRFMSAQIRVGVQGIIKDKWRWEAQMVLVNFPEFDLNTDPGFRVRMNNSQIQVGICRFFSW